MEVARFEEVADEFYSKGFRGAFEGFGGVLLEAPLGNHHGGDGLEVIEVLGPLLFVVVIGTGVNVPQ